MDRYISEAVELHQNYIPPCWNLVFSKRKWFAPKGCKVCPCRTDPITTTCLYNFDPLKPHFYIVKLGFTWVYIIFLFLLKTIDCGYSYEPPPRVLTSIHNLCFEQKYEKYQNFLSENFLSFFFFFFFFFFFVVKFSVYLNRYVFIMSSIAKKPRRFGPYNVKLNLNQKREVSGQTKWNVILQTWNTVICIRKSIARVSFKFFMASSAQRFFFRTWILGFMKILHIFYIISCSTGPSMPFFCVYLLCAEVFIV